MVSWQADASSSCPEKSASLYLAKERGPQEAVLAVPAQPFGASHTVTEMEKRGRMGLFLPPPTGTCVFPSQMLFLFAISSLSHLNLEIHGVTFKVS